MPKRKTTSFIQTYEDMLAPHNAPASWRHWAGLWTLSAAIERRVWCMTKGEPLFPNLFIMLVGRSGGGKSQAINRSQALVGSLGADRLSASSMTSAYLAGAVSKNERPFVNKATQQGMAYNALNVISTDLQVLIPAYDLDLLAKLTDLYDCGPYSEGRRDDDKTFFCERTCMTMLAGTTMTHLLGTFPDQAWGMGFMSRVIMVYAEPGKRKSLFGSSYSNKELIDFYNNLKHDIKILSQVQGEFLYEDKAAKLLDDFYMYQSDSGAQLGGPPIPDHPNLLTYCERRHVHLEKLMMLYAIDKGEQVLTEEHFVRAYDTLTSAESGMPEIFKAQVAGSEMATANELLFTMSKIYGKTHLPITEGAVYAKLVKRVTSYQAKGIIEMLVNTRKMKVLGAKDREAAKLPPGKYYIPLAITFDEE